MTNTTRAVLFTSFLLGITGYAQEVLDQAYYPTNFDTFAVSFGASHGQSFTVGVTGSLTRVEVLIGRNESVTNAEVEWILRKTIAGVPAAGKSGVLACGTVPYGSLSVGYTFVSCLIRPGTVRVKPGDVLAITLSCERLFTWPGSWSVSYARGSHQVSAFPPSKWQEDTTTDLTFKTYVTPPP